MEKFIIITADTNDGDYITERYKITDEQIAKIIPVVEAIKKIKFEPYIVTKPGYWSHKQNSNYPTGEMHRSDLGEKSAKDLYGHLEGFELFNSFCPLGEYGIHTIVSVEIIQVAETINLL